MGWVSRSPYVFADHADRVVVVVDDDDETG